jgi:hypothetical protein
MKAAAARRAGLSCVLRCGAGAGMKTGLNAAMPQYLGPA